MAKTNPPIGHAFGFTADCNFCGENFPTTELWDWLGGKFVVCQYCNGRLTKFVSLYIDEMNKRAQSE